MVVQIASNCRFVQYQIGDNKIMDEWYSGLPAGKVYKFYTTLDQPIVSATSTSFTLGEVLSPAFIIENDTTKIAANWEIRSLAGTWNYSITDNGA